jgi:hypothetical protein
MGDIIRNDAALAPQWKQLCLSATLELDPLKLLERIAAAHAAILDRVEDGHSKPPNGEQLALKDALSTLQTLETLHRIAEHQTANSPRLADAQSETNDQLQLAGLLQSGSPRNRLDENGRACSDSRD